MADQKKQEQLSVEPHQPKSLVQFFRESPLVGVNFDPERNRDPGREIDARELFSE